MQEHHSIRIDGTVAAQLDERVTFERGGVATVTPHPHPQLSDRHLAMLQASAIADDIITERGYATLRTAAELDAALPAMGRYQRRPGLAIPTYRLGKPHLVMLRPDEPRERVRNGKMKPIKYESPDRHTPYLDILPRFKRWLGDSSRELWITEGAKKADAIASVCPDVVPVSISGVWNWRTKDRKPLADFDDLALQGRAIVLCFDSDASTNRQVAAALRALARMLTIRGASVRIAHLPAAADGDKQGIDDALAAGMNWADIVRTLVLFSSPDDNPLPDLADAADAFVADNIDTLRWDTVDNVWRKASGGIWPEVQEDDTAMQSDAVAILRRLKIPVSSVRKVRDVITLARSGLAYAFVKQAGIIAFANGIYDANTNTTRAIDTDDYLIDALPYELVPNGAYPAIATYLKQTVPDEAGRRNIAAHIGVALLGDTRLHYALYVFGPMRSGKSTLLALANAVCGHPPAANASHAVLKAELEGARARHSFRNHRICTLDEVAQDIVSNEEIAKKMLAHGGVPMRAMFQNEKTTNAWVPKMMMTSNERPRYRDDSGALSERLIFISAPNTRERSARNIHLLDELLPELGAFAWACLQEARALLARGRYLDSPASDALKRDIEQQNDPLRAWLAEYVVTEPGAVISVKAAYDAYRAYVQENGHRQQLATPRFSSAVAEHYRGAVHQDRRYVLETDAFGKQRTVRVRAFVGLRLRNDDDPDTESRDSTGQHGTARDSRFSSAVPSDIPHQDAVNGTSWDSGTAESENSPCAEVTLRKNFLRDTYPIPTQEKFSQSTVPSVPDTENSASGRGKRDGTVDFYQLSRTVPSVPSVPGTPGVAGDTVTVDGVMFVRSATPGVFDEVWTAIAGHGTHQLRATLTKLGTWYASANGAPAVPSASLDEALAYLALLATV